MRLLFGRSARIARSAGVSKRCNLRLFEFIIEVHISGWMTAAPVAFVATLGGLAMLRALQGAFVAGFGRTHTMGALVAFVVTASNVAFWNIGAAFWGLVAGVAVSWLLERSDWT